MFEPGAVFEMEVGPPESTWRELASNSGKLLNWKRRGGEAVNITVKKPGSNPSGLRKRHERK
jgi:hypothetical protein